MHSFQHTLFKFQYILKMYDMVPCSVIRSFHDFISVSLSFFLPLSLSVYTYIYIIIFQKILHACLKSYLLLLERDTFYRMLADTDMKACSSRVIGVIHVIIIVSIYLTLTVGILDAHLMNACHIWSGDMNIPLTFLSGVWFFVCPFRQWCVFISPGIEA
jgi:hypothetical protein